MVKSKRPHSEAFASSPSTSQESAPSGQEPAAAAPASNSNEENPFKDCVVAICGHHEPWKTAILKEMVSRLSAENSRIVKRITTHLVTTETEVNANAKQVARARGNPTCSIVSLQWLLDSDKAGTPLPVKPYRLDTATVATPSPARNADFPSDNPTPAAQQQDTENTIESPGFHEHLFTFQVNLAQPGSGAQNVEEHDGINASERPTKKRRVRRAELEAENDDQIDTFADDSVAVSEAQPATPLGQPHTGAAARQTPVQSPNNEEEDSNYLDSSYGQQQVLDHGFHHAVYPALYPNPTTGLNMMPAAETHTQAHVEQAADTQGHAETTYSLEDVNNSPEQQSHGQEHGFDQNHQQPPYHTHNHPAATNATSMIPVTTAQDLIRNGQCPANYPAPQQQPEPARARDRLLPIPSYARSTWNEFHAVWAGDHSALKLEQERLRAGGLQIQYYNPTAGEPLYVPGYVDPEYPHALTWLSGNGRQ